MGALILDTIRKLILELFKNEKPSKAGVKPPAERRGRHVFTVCIFAAAFLLSVLLSPSPVWIVAGAALTGLLFFRFGSATGNADADTERNEGKS